MKSYIDIFLIAVLLLAAVGTAAVHTKRGGTGFPPEVVPVNIREVTGYNQVKPCSNSSCLYTMNATGDNQFPEPNPYSTAPYLLALNGTRFQIGYDYASLMAEQTSYTYTTFFNSLTNNNKTIEANIAKFSDFLWEKFYVKHVPQVFLDELKGMAQWTADHPTEAAQLEIQPELVSSRFLVMANMPADTPNMIAGLEREFEHGWPSWLKVIVNDVIEYLEKHFVHSCDAYGVWGSRTQNGRLYTSRNLDYNSNTGINRYKLLTVFNIQDSTSGAVRKSYASYGFSFGLGALAGQSVHGVTTSEMNLDNSQVTFSGLPFPLRLRYVLENAVDLESAMTVWNSTHNTNSFNFLIGSAKDNQAYALETIFNYTAVFPADSPIEAAATYNCGLPPHVDPTCHKWTTNQTTGKVPIGFPLKEAVWRTNHGLNPVVMATQEPLFNNTIFRYNLMHDLFVGYQSANYPIADFDAVSIVASLGIKGRNYLTCEQPLLGDNVLSVAYVPGEMRAFVAWEDGSGSSWRPASCATYLHVNLTQWW